MPDFPKFTVVYASEDHLGRTKVEKFDPWAGSPAGGEQGHALVGVTATDADASQQLTIIRSGYVRGLSAGDITGWEPADGTLLWASAAGKVSAVRPTTGLQVCVGTYIGNNVADVHVNMLPSIGELSYVSRVLPEEFYVFIWSSVDGAYVPRQLDHGQDLLGLEDDDHPQYLSKADLRQAFLFMGGD